MKSLLLGLWVALGLLVADVSAGCLGCGNQGTTCGPVQCDQSYLWNGFSPSQATYSPSCWSGGCGNGIFNGAGVGLLDRIKCHIQNGGGGIACNGTSPGLGWDSMGSCCGGPGLGGYGGSSLSTFHGMSYAGPRLMGNSRGGCCPTGGCFAGPCGFGGGGALFGGGCGTSCHSFQTGWLSGLMERLRNHCSACSYSGGSLDPCGTLGGCGAYPAGNLNLNFGEANYGGCDSGSCGLGGGCASGNCGSGGVIMGGGMSAGYEGGYIQGGSVGGAGCGNGGNIIGTPTPMPQSMEPTPMSTHPSARKVEYPSTGASAFFPGLKAGLFRSANKAPKGFGNSQGTSNYFSVTR